MEKEQGHGQRSEGWWELMKEAKGAEGCPAALTGRERRFLSQWEHRHFREPSRRTVALEPWRWDSGVGPDDMTGARP